MSVEPEGGRLDRRHVVVKHPTVRVAAPIADLLARGRPPPVVHHRVFAVPRAVVERVRIFA